MPAEYWIHNANSSWSPSSIRFTTERPEAREIAVSCFQPGTLLNQTKKLDDQTFANSRPCRHLQTSADICRHLTLRLQHLDTVTSFAVKALSMWKLLFDSQATPQQLPMNETCRKNVKRVMEMRNAQTSDLGFVNQVLWIHVDSILFLQAWPRHSREPELDTTRGDQVCRDRLQAGLPPGASNVDAVANSFEPWPLWADGLGGLQVGKLHVSVPFWKYSDQQLCVDTTMGNAFASTCFNQLCLNYLSSTPLMKSPPSRHLQTLSTGACRKRSRSIPNRAVHQLFRRHVHQTYRELLHRYMGVYVYI